jgi:hypothetical protein
MAEKAQNFENHAKTVPVFHLGVLPVLAANVIWSIVHVSRHPNFGNGMAVIVALALLFLAFCARVFALTVQDRVIRLEMRLRLQQLLPENLRARIPEFKVNQLVALRFASDAELPELARKVLDEKLNDRKAIKKLIRNWQPDYLRA